MLGRSIYLSHPSIPNLNKDDYCFISLHMPEDFGSDFKTRALDLISKIDAKIIADISPAGIKELGYDSFADLAKDKLVWGLRPDYGLSTDEILEASQYTNIVINASVIDNDLVLALYDYGSQIYAMHNFYPRPETGLDCEYCKECTDYLHNFDAQVFAFISGDADLRGPIKQGLPSVEAFRDLSPYIQYLFLKKLLDIDIVFVGDISLDPKTEKLIQSTEKDGVIRIPAKVPNDLYDKVFTIRPDSNEIVSRLNSDRGIKVSPKNNIERAVGTITMDNDKYLRYSGEIQIVKYELAPDERVNVIGHILDEYLPIIDVCSRNSKIMFVV
ncbi:MAG: MupG family TIM beta-alpha barrel fold protein [Coriobacteriia bacterium]|nr:MupG family TIM beta-alpha barrel fold protein [Coriobacteriia bacterium]